jgi:ribonuclease HI
MDDREVPRGVASWTDQPVVVHFDGACQPPKGGGVATFGFTVEGGGFLHEEAGLATRPYSERATNNVAEYVAAIRALEWLREQGYAGPVSVVGDSQLVIRQMTGEYEVKADHLKDYHARLHQLVREFRSVEFRWVRREENSRADALSKAALTEAGVPARAYRPERPVGRPEGETKGDGDGDDADP